MRYVHPAISAIIDILEQQHARQMAFIVPREAALPGKTVGVAIGAEQPVPDRQVAEIEGMDVDLVMNRMQFGGLDDIFQPSRRLEIGMIEELSRRCKHVEPHRALERAAEQRIEYRGRERAVGEKSIGCL